MQILDANGQGVVSKLLNQRAVPLPILLLAAVLKTERTMHKESREAMLALANEID